MNENDGIQSTGGPGIGNLNKINSPGARLASLLGRGVRTLGIIGNIFASLTDVKHILDGDVWIAAPGLESLYPVFGRYVPKDDPMAGCAGRHCTFL